jgi:hypothetical protein
MRKIKGIKYVEKVLRLKMLRSKDEGKCRRLLINNLALAAAAANPSSVASTPLNRQLDGHMIIYKSKVK